MNIVRHERFGLHKVVDDRMPAIADVKRHPVVDDRARVVVLQCHLRQAAKDVNRGNGAGQVLDRAGPGDSSSTQLLEKFVLEGLGFVLGSEHFVLNFLELRGHEALGIG